MLKNYYNLRNEIVGVYDTEARTYHTKRFVQKGQVFLRKNWFEGQLKERAIAIDSQIVEYLISQGCQKIIFTIIGMEKFAYSVWISPEDILKKGIKINFDKKNQEGQNFTGFGEQYVISSISDCHKLLVNQLELVTTKEYKYE